MTRADLLTCTRAPLAIGLTVLTAAGDRSSAAVLVVLFAVIDYGDGWLARHDGTESAERRAVDSVIDRIAVVGFFAAAALHDPIVGVLAGVLLVANVGLAVLAHRSLRQGLVIRAGPWHRLWSVAGFAAALVWLSGSPLADKAVGVAVATYLGCGVQLVQLHRRALGHAAQLAGSRSNSGTRPPLVLWNCAAPSESARELQQARTAGGAGGTAA